MGMSEPGRKGDARSGYSGTPQLKKLGIVEGTTLAVVGKPRGWSFADSLPSGVLMAKASTGTPVDVLLAFARDASMLPLAIWAERIFPSGALWVAWPRKAAGHVSNVDENLIRDSALALGLVDVKVAAIDTDWSGLKLVWRKELRKR
jgi:hypothetical protein